MSVLLLIGDHDLPRASRLAKILDVQGFRVIHLATAERLLSHLLGDGVSLLVLHHAPPVWDSFFVASDLRERGATVPIISIFDSSHYSLRVTALSAGCDDALSSPYAIEELIARIQALLRRSRMGHQDAIGSSICYTDLLVDTDRRQVWRAGQPVKLTVKEYDLLLCLLRNRQQVLPRQRILHLVWGDTWVGDDNLLDVYIRYLRKKIERPDLEPLIHTVRGVGFVLK